MLTTTADAQYRRGQHSYYKQKQNISTHELSIYSLGGYSSLSYTLSDNGSKNGGNGGGAGLGYTFNINTSLGIVTGIEMTTYSSEASFGSVSGEYRDEKEKFTFSYSLDNRKETQNVSLFSIPVMAQYSSGSSTRFYVSGGFKFGFPISATANIAPCTVTTLGDTDDELGDYIDLTSHGLDKDISIPATKEDIELGFSIALALETGVRFTLTDKIGLYTGLYFDYGLNSIQKVNDKHPLEYDIKHLHDSDAKNKRPFFYYSVLNTGLVDKVNLLSIGLKVKISLNLGN
jgi:hypothetical protein